MASVVKGRSAAVRGNKDMVESRFKVYEAHYDRMMEKSSSYYVTRFFSLLKKTLPLSMQTLHRATSPESKRSIAIKRKQDTLGMTAMSHSRLIYFDVKNNPMEFL